MARALGVAAHHPHEWRNGKRALTPETVAQLCDLIGISGEEAREWVAIAIIENPKNSSKAEVLRKVFFACWVAGVGVTSLLQPNSADAAPVAGNDGTVVRYVNWLRHLFGKLKTLLHPVPQPV